MIRLALHATTPRPGRRRSTVDSAAGGADPAELLVRAGLAEYEKLKDEQAARIGVRDQLIYATLIASAAVVSAAAAQGAAYVLLLPPVAVLLGWTYLVNDRHVTDIGRYLREDLGPRLAARAGQPGQVVFGWEVRRGGARRAARKRLQLGADLLAFVVLPAAGLVWYWCLGPWSTALLALSAVEIALLGLLAAQIASYADLHTRPAGRDQPRSGGRG